MREKNMKKIVTLGEIMLRLSTPGNSRFVQSDSFDVVYGGGEANVAVSLAAYGHDAYFVTKLPKHEIGQSAVNALRRYGVNTNFIARGGDRVGIYYLETGASMRPSKVIYDRAHSAIAEADPCDFDFDAIMEKATYEVVKIGKTKSTKKEHHLPIHGFVWTPNGDKAVADFVYRKNQPVAKGEREEGWWSLV
jgi:sugar/nucleoside kinase (ribokinase family)